MKELNIREHIKNFFLQVRTLKKARGHHRHIRRAQKVDRSFAGEYEHLRKLTAQLGIRDGFIVDIGAADGVTQSCTHGFFRDPAWSGLAIEARSEAFSLLAYLLTEYSNVQMALCHVTPDNVAAILAGHDTPKEFTILNLDIDSYDLFVMDAMLMAEYRPRIISMEVAETIPPPIYFAVNFDRSFVWEGKGPVGCSLSAAVEVVKPYGYRLESLKFNNAMFVHDDICGESIRDTDTETAYKEGFLNHPERETLFPWDTDMVEKLNCPTEDAMRIINEKYSDYSGKYTLRLAR